MKTETLLPKMIRTVKIYSLAFVFFIGLSSFNNNNKVTICHIPPGNPGNCHEITISMNALQTHLDHGDKLFCREESRYTDFLNLVGNDKERVIKQF